MIGYDKFGNYRISSFCGHPVRIYPCGFLVGFLLPLEKLEGIQKELVKKRKPI